MIGQNLRVLSNSSKVSAARPILTAYSFFEHNGLCRIVDRAGGSSWQSYRIIATRLVFNVTVQRVVTTSSSVPVQVVASHYAKLVTDVMTVVIGLMNGSAVSYISFVYWFV